ncbi:hypothetical protein D3C85_1853740 [compost metagenome]
MAVQHAEISFNDRLLCRSQSRVGLDNYCYFDIPDLILINSIYGFTVQVGVTTQSAMLNRHERKNARVVDVINV